MYIKTALYLRSINRDMYVMTNNHHLVLYFVTLLAFFYDVYNSALGRQVSRGCCWMADFRPGQGEEIDFVCTEQKKAKSVPGLSEHLWFVVGYFRFSPAFGSTLM